MLCDEHDQPATHELSWIEHPGTADAAGRSTPVCDLPGCDTRTRHWIDMTGEFVEALPVATTQPAALPAAA